MFCVFFFRNPEEIQPTHFSLFNGDGSVKPSVLGPPPQIKILKRPQHNGLSHANQQGAYASANGQGKPKPQVKTLQQVFFFCVEMLQMKNCCLLKHFHNRKKPSMRKPGFEFWEKLLQPIYLPQTLGMLLEMLG